MFGGGACSQLFCLSQSRALDLGEATPRTNVEEPPLPLPSQLGSVTTQQAEMQTVPGGGNGGGGGALTAAGTPSKSASTAQVEKEKKSEVGCGGRTAANVAPVLRLGGVPAHQTREANTNTMVHGEATVMRGGTRKGEKSAADFELSSSPFGRELGTIGQPRFYRDTRQAQRTACDPSLRCCPFCHKNLICRSAAKGVDSGFNRHMEACGNKLAVAELHRVVVGSMSLLSQVCATAVCQHTRVDSPGYACRCHMERWSHLQFISKRPFSSGNATARASAQCICSRHRTNCL